MFNNVVTSKADSLNQNSNRNSIDLRNKSPCFGSAKPQVSIIENQRHPNLNVAAMNNDSELDNKVMEAPAAITERDNGFDEAVMAASFSMSSVRQGGD